MHPSRYFSEYQDRYPPLKLHLRNEADRVARLGRDKGDSNAHSSITLEQLPGVDGAFVVKKTYRDGTMNESEMRILKMLEQEHPTVPHFVRLYCWAVENGSSKNGHKYRGQGREDEVIAVAEYCEAGTLRKWMETPHRVEEWKVIVFQILFALLTVQSHDICHGDLHWSNVLLSRVSPVPRERDYWHYRLKNGSEVADFYVPNATCGLQAKLWDFSKKYERSSKKDQFGDLDMLLGGLHWWPRREWGRILGCRRVPPFSYSLIRDALRFTKRMIDLEPDESPAGNMLLFLGPWFDFPEQVPFGSKVINDVPFTLNC